MRKWLACVAFGLLAGACTPELQLATEPAYSPAWCSAARAMGNRSNYLLEVARCHMRDVAGFPKDDARIDFYLTEAARRGNVQAGAELAARGQPIPDDDLRREAVARQEAERNRQALIAATQPRIYQVRPATGVVHRPVGPTFTPPRVSTPHFQHRQESRSTSTRRNCTNNVCRTETTTCVNGRCTTQVTN